MNGAYIEIETPSGPKKFALGDRPLTIGRHPDNVLVIQDDRASRFHCVIESADKGFCLRDLGSRNGTKVNEQRVDETQLNPGDQFRIGKTRFRYIDPDGESVAHAESSSANTRRATNGHGAKTASHPEPTQKRKKKTRSRPAEPVMPAIEPDVDYNALLEDIADGPSPGDYEAELRRMASAGTAARDVDESTISLVDTRGRVVHLAAAEAALNGSKDAKRKTKSKSGDHGADDESGEGAGILRLLLLLAMRARATDIHLEPKGDDYQARIRVDGMMVEGTRIPKSVAQRVLGVVKVLCEIDISQRNVIQEGHFSSRVPARHVDYRVSFTPSMYGQKLVLRVLDLANSPQHLRELHLPAWMYETIRKVSRQDAGMILVCGPTGSGKTTTLYSVLRDIDTDQRNVITIEDPVEYQIHGVTQIPIAEDQGNTFSTLLRSVLRQDPDVLLVGEVRDKQTAQTAMQAAMTGHLVLTTLHAKDTIGSIFRLLDLEVEPYLVASGLNLVLAQRLVRLLCSNCRIDKKPTPQQTLQMGRYVEGVNEVWYPVGCERCLRTGYLGRRAIFETLFVTDELRDVVLKEPTIHAIREAIKMTMFQSLSGSGFHYVLDGLTSFEEIERVVGAE